MGARYREMGIKTATREQLVVMLYEGALSNIRRAEALHGEGRLGDRGTAISKALAIVAELQQGLDFEVGGEIAENLGSLYSFVSDRLIEANLTHRVEALAEAARILETLGEAWAEIAKNAAPAPTVATP